MKKILEKLNNDKTLLAFIYIIFIMGYLLNGIFNFATDLIKNTDEIPLTVNDFMLNDLIVNEDATLTAIGYDAQMIYQSDKEIKSIYYSLENSSTGVVCSYYLENDTQHFSNYDRLFPEFSVNDEAFYIYPSNTHIIRLDIGSEYGENYDFKEIILNKEIPFVNYFKLANSQILTLVITPIILFSIIRFSQSLYKNYFKK